MNSKWIKIAGILILGVFLEMTGSCRDTQTLQTPVTAALTATSVPATPTLTPQPSPSETMTPHPAATLTPSPKVVVQKVEIIRSETLPEKPENVDLNGVIVMSPKLSERDNLYLIEASTQKRIADLPPYPYYGPNQIWGTDVSPDRKLLAYLVDMESGEHLYVVNGRGQILVDELMIDSEGNYLLAHSEPRDRALSISLYWLDNVRLMTDIVPLSTSLIMPAEAAVLFKPFTGESVEYLPVYPEIVWSIWYLGWDRGYNSGMVFDPTMTRVLYARSDERVSIWDLENDREIILLSEKSVSGHGPIWKEDGSAFLIDLFSGDEERREWEPRDLFLYTRDGQASRLTYFGEQFTDSFAHSPRWSPDGKKIAFVFGSEEQDYCPQEETIFYPAVIDLDQPDVVRIFCTNIDYFSNPIWSPNGEQLIYFLSIEESFENIVIDLETGSSFTLSNDGQAKGWMLSE